MKSVGELLREYLKERGWLKANPYEPLFREWADIVGESLAEHVRLLDVQDGVLILEADHPGWLQMIQLRKQMILEGARARAPEATIAGLRTRLGAGDSR
jgi:predicted nucleic acid-binding Zn ribbon protein